MESEVLLNEIKVMYVASESGPQGAAPAFTKLESKLPTLKGRRFYGLITDEGNTYRSGVEIIEGEDPAALGLEVTRIPAGKYVRVKITDWLGKLDYVYPTFKFLSSKYKEDVRRPRIEFYRSKKELFILLPISVNS